MSFLALNDQTGLSFWMPCQITLRIVSHDHKATTRYRYKVQVKKFITYKVAKNTYEMHRILCSLYYELHEAMHGSHYKLNAIDSIVKLRVVHQTLGYLKYFAPQSLFIFFLYLYSHYNDGFTSHFVCRVWQKFEAQIKTTFITDNFSSNEPQWIIGFKLSGRFQEF